MPSYTALTLHQKARDLLTVAMGYTDGDTALYAALWLLHGASESNIHHAEPTRWPAQMTAKQTWVS